MLIKKVMTTLKYEGFFSLIKKIINYLKYRWIKTENHLDEVDIVFDILQKKQGVMIDVGAHHGSALAKFAKIQWKIYAFEPDKNNRKILIENYGNYKNVDIDSRGCSDKEQKNVSFFTSEESTGISGLSAFVDSHIETDKIEITTLVKAIKEKSIKEVDFLKIDTEGFDYFVLCGFPWDKIKPSMIVCEFEDKKTKPLGYNYQELGNYLIEQGYKVVLSEWYPIERYGIRHKWRCFKSFPSELEDINGWGNMIAYKENFHEEMIKKLLKYERKCK